MVEGGRGWGGNQTHFPEAKSCKLAICAAHEGDLVGRVFDCENKMFHQCNVFGDDKDLERTVGGRVFVLVIGINHKVMRSHEMLMFFTFYFFIFLSHSLLLMRPHETLVGWMVIFTFYFLLLLFLFFFLTFCYL